MQGDIRGGATRRYREMQGVCVCTVSLSTIKLATHPNALLRLEHSSMSRFCAANTLKGGVWECMWTCSWRILSMISVRCPEIASPVSTTQIKGYTSRGGGGGKGSPRLAICIARILSLAVSPRCLWKIRQSIWHIEKMEQVLGDIGRCRGWGSSP